MRNDENWRKTICEDFNISAEEYDKRLSRFLDRCNDDKERKGKLHHDSFVDCQSHLRYWMTKAYPAPQPAPRPRPTILTMTLLSPRPPTTLSTAASVEWMIDTKLLWHIRLV